MDEFEFDNRLFYKFNSYNSTYFLGYPYKNLWLSIETEFKPNEIRKVAFFYDLYFPNKLKKNKIDVFDTNLKKLEKQLYDYFNPYFNNYRSNELYKFYYCYNHTFTKDVYDNLIDALANKKYSLLYKNVSTKNIIEIYKYLLIFYPNIFGKIGDLFYDFWKTKVFFPYFTDWQSGQKDFDFAGIKDFIYGDNDKLSKIQRQNLYFYFLDNIDKIKEIYLILNGLKLNDTFSEKVFQRILNNSCKHSNFWYDIGSEDLESLIDLYSLFYSSTMETLPRGIKKERREKAQIFFCKNKLEVEQALGFLKDINSNSKLFDSFKNKHNDITDVNFLYNVALYYNAMFPYDNMEKFLLNININFDNIKKFFDDPNNKNKFMDNIESIKKIKFSKDFLSEFERINKDKSTIDSRLLTDDILNYILDAYDIFFRNEIKSSDKIDKNAKLEFLKKNLNNVIKLYYICTNKKEEFDKDKIFTKQVYYEFMINSCTFGKDGWAIIDKDELKHIVFCYDILKIDKNKLNLDSVVQEEQYNYFINNKDKLYSLISEIEKMYKIDFTYIDNIYKREIINGNTFHTFDTKDFILNSNTKDLNKLNEFIDLVKYFYEDNKNDFIVEKKTDNTNPAKSIDYTIYKIKEENYKTIKELFDDKKIKNKLKDVNKIVYKNFLNYPKKFNYSIPQDTLIYIANKYNKMFPNELDSNYLIKKHKFLFFFEKTKPYPLLEYLINFFSKNTLKLKILYETLNNIQSNSQKQKQSKQQQAQAQAQPQGQGQTVKDFIDKMKAIHNDATQIAQIKTNLGSILDLMEQERKNAIANIQNIRTNKFYGNNILSKLQQMDFVKNKNDLTTQLITTHINDTYVDQASPVNIIKANTIDSKYLKVILDLFEALKNNNNFDARNFLNRFSKIRINTQNNTIDKKEITLCNIISLIFKNLNLLHSNITGAYYFEISSTSQINAANNIGKLIVFLPALIDTISDNDLQNELLKFVEFFRYVFFMFFFDFKTSIPKKAKNANNKKVILEGYYYK